MATTPPAYPAASFSPRRQSNPFGPLPTAPQPPTDYFSFTKSEATWIEKRRRKSGYKKRGLIILIVGSVFSVIFIVIWQHRSRSTPTPRHDLRYGALLARSEFSKQDGTLPIYPLILFSGPRYQRIEKRSELPSVVCGTGRKGCTEAGQGNICCAEEDSCQRTNNTLTGVMCCPNGLCSDRNPVCPLSTYACEASSNGGCCPLGTMCTFDRCIPRDDMARYLSILDAASIGVNMSTKTEGLKVKGTTPASISLLVVPTTTTAVPSPTQVPVRIAEERIREVEVTRAFSLSFTETATKTQFVYTASPMAQPNAVLVAAPSPTTLPDIDGDGLSGTQDPTESRASTVVPKLTAASSNTDLSITEAPPSSSEVAPTKAGKRKKPAATTMLISPESTTVIGIGGTDERFTRLTPAVYAHIETTQDNKVIERYVSPEQVAREKETIFLKGSMTGAGVANGVQWRLVLFSVMVMIAACKV